MIRGKQKIVGKAILAAGAYLTGAPLAEPAVEGTFETLQRYHRLGELCLAGAVLCLVAAIFLCTYFHIGSVFGSLTGYRERKTIQRWEETELLCGKDEDAKSPERGRKEKADEKR